MSMLAIAGLRAGYGKIEVLHDVALSVGEGQIVTLIGANGAGKTTLLKTVSGLIRPTGGTIDFEGQSLVRRPAHRIVQLGISHVPEGRAILKRMTVFDNLRMGAYVRNDAEVGRDISARPIASICCSPPDSVPAACCRRSASRGNWSKTRARSAAISRRSVRR